jgi:NAD(P)-dependent dehydrogenase (short-subunit alcohol dehydrogenase family)
VILQPGPHRSGELDRLLGEERRTMDTLEGRNVVVTGGSRGLGLGIVEALVRQKAKVTVVARDAGRLAEVAKQFGVAVIAGDVIDESLARKVVREVKPDVLILNAGTNPVLVPIHEQTWEGFSKTWNTDVKSTFHWIQEVIRAPLPRSSRVIIGSSGAAIGGSPLSGGHAGAKRMLWMMARYANGVATELDLGIHFQVIVPQQILGDTAHGRAAAEAYATKKGVSLEKFLSQFGEQLTTKLVGDHVVSILTDPKYASGVVFGLKGGTGISSLDT